MCRVRTLLCVLLASVLWPAAVSARLTAGAALTEAPRFVIPLLDKSTRMDMLDYFRSGMKHPMPNAMGGESEVTELTDDVVAVRVTDASTCRIALLPAGRDTVVMVIDTYHTPAPDSRVTFYDRSWHALDGRGLLQEPLPEDWCVAKRSRAEVAEVLPYVLAEYGYDAATRRLTVANRAEDTLSPDVRDRIMALMHREITYTWNGKRFVRDKVK